MATCSHADRLIPLLHDNELQSPLRREMVAHMATCVTCARTFSLLEREQELFTQAIEERVDSIDFSGFWQTVEAKLSEPTPSWAIRLRLWYESWRPAWAFPVPAWAVATLLLSLVLPYLYLSNNFFLTAGNLNPSPSPTTPLPQGPPQQVAQGPTEDSQKSPLIKDVGLSDDQERNNNQAQIESICTYGSGAVAINIYYDYESNSTVISCGNSTSEYPQ